MTDNEKIELANTRYLNALHAMQSGVAMEMNHNAKPTEPKHLRVGINSALIDSAALASLLMRKGIITHLEYAEELATMMEAEHKRYEQHLSELIGFNITLG